MPTLPLLLTLSLIIGPARALTLGASKALAELQAEAGRPIVSSSIEGLRADSARSFTGEKFAPKASPLDAPSGPSAAGGKREPPPSYHFEGSKPLDGVTIYTPRKDAPGQDTTTGGGASANDPGKLLKWATWGGLGVGAALAIGGIWCPPLLFLGGFLMGVGATLWVIGKLFGGK